MTTATTALITVKAFTEKRDDETLNVSIKHGYDGPIFLGTMRRSVFSNPSLKWYCESLGGHRFIARTKREAILMMCHLEGSHYYPVAAFCFGGSVLRVEP